jgi:cell division protease FtsH
VKDESGFGYWLLNVLPFLLPVVLVVFFIWMLTRQVKGAGMQAFTFGQSKARITDPNDKNNRVTFKDVAGAKEAKEGATCTVATTLEQSFFRGKRELRLRIVDIL